MRKMARTHNGGYELLLFLKEKGISLKAAKEIIAAAETEIIKWKIQKEKAISADYETRA